MQVSARLLSSKPWAGPGSAGEAARGVSNELKGHSQARRLVVADWRNLNNRCTSKSSHQILYSSFTWIYQKLGTPT
jgi:hypothetical protein